MSKNDFLVRLELHVVAVVRGPRRLRRVRGLRAVNRGAGVRLGRPRESVAVARRMKCSPRGTGMLHEPVVTVVTASHAPTISSSGLLDVAVRPSPNSRVALFPARSRSSELSPSRWPCARLSGRSRRRRRQLRAGGDERLEAELEADVETRQGGASLVRALTVAQEMSATSASNTTRSRPALVGKVEA